MAMPGAVPGSGKTGLVKCLGVSIHGARGHCKAKIYHFSGTYLSVSQENDVFLCLQTCFGDMSLEENLFSGSGLGC